MKPLVIALACASLAYAADPPKARPVDDPSGEPTIPVPPPLPPIPQGPREVPTVDPQLAIPEKVTSRSYQFTISGGDASLRSSISLLVEQTKDGLLSLAGMKDEWKIPITVRLVGKPGDPLPPRPVEFDLFYNEKGWVLDLALHVERGVDQARFQRAVMAALVYEQALRKLPPGPREDRLFVPPWLVEGLQESVELKAGRSDRKLYAANRDLYNLKELFALSQSSYDSLDGASRAAFRVASGAMVMALVKQSEGKDGFQQFISEAANFGGEMPVLMKRCFPDLNLSETSLAKWWKLTMTEIGQLQLTDIMSVADTDVALEDALKLRFRDTAGTFLQKPLASGWQDIASLAAPARAEAVRSSEDSLVRLSYRCFPSYRPLIKEYQSILSDVVKGKTTRTAAQLTNLSEVRNTMRTRDKQANDYMDWFEITRARETSGAFEDYLKLKERLKYQQPVSQDPVSSYLDGMQKIYDYSGKTSKPASRNPATPSQ